MLEKISQRLLNLVKAVAVLIFGYIVALNLGYTSFTYSSWYPLIFNASLSSSIIKAILGVLLLFGIIFLSNTLSKKLLIIIAILVQVFFLSLKIFIVYQYESYPIADSYLVLEAANAFVYNSSYLPEFIYQYLTHIPRQLGIVSLLIPLVKLFQYNYLSVLFFQAFMVQSAIVLLTVALYRLKGIQSAFLVSILLNLFIPNSFLSLLIYGDSYAFFFLSLTFFFYTLIPKGKLYIVLMYGSLILAFFARTTTNIWVLAAMLLLMLYIHKDKHLYKHILALIIVIIFPYLLLTQLFSMGTYSFENNNYPNNTWLRIGLGYSGFDQASPGYYNDQIERDFLDLDQNTVDMEAYNASLISKNIQNLFETNTWYSFFNTKMIISWTDADFEMMTRMYPFYGDRIDNPYQSAEEILYGSASMGTIVDETSIFVQYRNLVLIFEKIFVFGILIFSVLSLIQKDSKDPMDYFISILLVGVFLFNLLFEIKGRYNFIVFNALIVYVAYRSKSFFEAVQQKLNH